MGACGSGNKRDRKPKNKDGKDDNFKKSAKVASNETISPSTNIMNITVIEIYSGNQLSKETEGKETLSSFLSSLNILLKGDFDIILENDKNLNEEVDTTLIDLLMQKFSGKIPAKIEIKIDYKGLIIPKDIKQAYIDKNPIIGSPIFDNPDFFGIITYNREQNLLAPYVFDVKDNEELLKFNSFSSYCNANGLLYMSGGENEENGGSDFEANKFNDFFYIDLKSLKNDKKKIQINRLQNLPENKAWHSMIFVPNNYIFIVGGANSKSVLIYDIDENTIKKDSEMNEEKSETTLCLVNDTFLYSFYGFIFQSDFTKNIERCNLRKQNREWNYVFCKENSIIPKVSFFGVSYYHNSDNEILLIGGNDSKSQENYNYVLKLPNEESNIFEIEEFGKQDDFVVVFREKLFIPVGENIAVNIPLVTGEEYQLFTINTETGIIDFQKKEFNLTTEGNLF